MIDSQRFRLLGIRTGKRIQVELGEEPVKDYIKVLNEETYYPFYGCYIYEKASKSLIYKPDLDVDIYNDVTENKVNVQISAIVGKNGSGKSTLLELIYLANYNLGCCYGLLDEWVPTNEIIKDKAISDAQQGKYQKCKPLSLSFELYFEKGGKVGKLIFNNKSIQYFQEESRHSDQIKFIVEPNVNELSDERDDLARLFYSIAVNYSIYGLNSEAVGKWVIPLFHKNDGYKTPLVINPMRDKGNFDINDEMEFATYRLLNNLLIQQKALPEDNIYVTDHQYVEKIRFKLKRFEGEQPNIIDKGNYISGPEKEVILLLDLYSAYYDELELDQVRHDLLLLPLKDDIQFYIIRKANKILRTYIEYSSIFLKKGETFNWEKSQDFAKALINDNSHITFKLKQALNYLRNCIYVQRQGNRLKWSNPQNDGWYEFTLAELLETMHSKEVGDIIFNIPPSIFTIEIELSKDSISTTQTQKAFFTDLSSGEQQLIHSVNTVLYHLNNLQSAHYGNDGRLAYTDVNIIFDEIELYFHPEYQRRFISYLIETINRLPITKDKGIKAVNILFSTHSPFILSDCPSQNLLLLHVDDISKRSKQITNYDQTFGGNIHDLLANSFFLSDGYTGEKAVEIVNGVITQLNTWSDAKSIEVSNEERSRVKTIISLIGNELVKRKLFEMYNDLFNDSDFRERMAQDYEKRAQELRNGN